MRKTLRELIEQSVQLPPETGGSGFHPVHCAACNDHSPRAGFKFSDGSVGYNCFNCSRKFIYVEGDLNISRTAVSILNAFGISTNRIMEVVNSNFFDSGGEISFESIRQAREHTLNLVVEDSSLPKMSFYLGKNKHPEIEAPLIEYLSARGVETSQIKAMYSLDERHLNRIILPCYQNSKLIHWQSRSIESNARPRYLTSFKNKQLAMWGHHNSFKHSGPLFITEGIFDAYFIDGMALLGSDLTPEKVNILSKIPRKKVVVIDSDANGNKLATAALELGWELAFPPDGLDVNKSVMKYGLFYTIHSLFKSRCQPEKSGLVCDGIDLQSALALQFKMF